MRSDPIYLFQELTWKASLGVLSVAGNVCKIILAEIFGVVKFGLENFMLSIVNRSKDLRVCMSY